VAGIRLLAVDRPALPRHARSDPFLQPPPPDGTVVPV
jgi:hypothetical protein